MVKTLQRNMVPIYSRKINNELWLSNSIIELIDPNETLVINKKTLHRAAENKAKTIFDNLFLDIRMLYPASIYILSQNESSINILWSGFDFKEREPISANIFLEYLIERYKILYDDADEVCMGLSGGYDSRLELAILRNVGKKVRCFNYITSWRENKIAKNLAHLTESYFESFNYDETIKSGWDIIQGLGYSSRWDGYFAPGLISSAGLYGKACEIFPFANTLFMNDNPFKGRFYSAPLKNIWHEELDDEVSKIIAKSKDDFSEHHWQVNACYPILYKSAARTASRISFFYEQGQPCISGEKETRELFSALPPKEGHGVKFLEFAIKKLDPRVAQLPLVTSEMNSSVREFGQIAKIPGISRILKKFSINANWQSLHSVGYDDMFRSIPELSSVGTMAIGKGALVIQQICMHLALIKKERNVTFVVQ